MKYLIYTIIAMAIALVISVTRCSNRAAEAKLQASNVETLATEARAYTVRDSLNALSTGVLLFERDELRRLRTADALLIKDMGLRLNRVQSTTKVSTVGRYDIVAPLKYDTIRVRDTIAHIQRLDYRTPYIDIRGEISADTLAASIEVRDTIVQVLHRVPRFKFLGIWFGTRGVRQEIVSKNPHTRIVAAEYIQIIQ